jgi:hypothetical protein
MVKNFLTNVLEQVRTGISTRNLCDNVDSLGYFDEELPGCRSSNSLRGACRKHNKKKVYSKKVKKESSKIDRPNMKKHHFQPTKPLKKTRAQKALRIKSLQPKSLASKKAIRKRN